MGKNSSKINILFLIVSIFLWLIVASWVFIVFLLSSENGFVSHERSLSLVWLFKSTINLQVSELFVRKLAIVIEFGFLDALFINLGRVFITSLIRGSIFQMGFFMSLTGAILSMIAMWLLIRFVKKLTKVAVSVIGAVFHVFGQFIIALIFLETPQVLYYAPVLLLVSVITGLIVGFVTVAIEKTNIIRNLKEKYKM